jgi:hypothetical protein
MIWLHPAPFPPAAPVSKLSLFVSLPVCRRSSELTDRRREEGVGHKVLIYTEHHSVCVCPFVGIGTPPVPLPQARGHTRLRLWGWGSPNSDDRRKSLALCLLCGVGEVSNHSSARKTAPL